MTTFHSVIKNIDIKDKYLVNGYLKLQEKNLFFNRKNEPYFNLHSVALIILVYAERLIDLSIKIPKDTLVPYKIKAGRNWTVSKLKQEIKKYTKSSVMNLMFMNTSLQNEKTLNDYYINNCSILNAHIYVSCVNVCENNNNNNISVKLRLFYDKKPRKIKFKYNPNNETIEEVVREMTDTLDLDQTRESEIVDAIQCKVNKLDKNLQDTTILKCEYARDKNVCDIKGTLPATIAPNQIFQPQWMKSDYTDNMLEEITLKKQHISSLNAYQNEFNHCLVELPAVLELSDIENRFDFMSTGSETNVNSLMKLNAKHCLLDAKNKLCDEYREYLEDQKELLLLKLSKYKHNSKNCVCHTLQVLAAHKLKCKQNKQRDEFKSIVDDQLKILQLKTKLETRKILQ